MTKMEMTLIRYLQESTQTVTGTNCANCKFVDSKGDSVSRKELNKQGGMKLVNSKETKLAQAADLITMPGSKFPSSKHKCGHPKINMYVTERQCCAYWDNPGVYRQFEKTIGE